MVKKKTHILLGVSATLFLSKTVFNVNTWLIPLQALIAVTASTFPDIDVWLRHRRTLHNLFALILSTITVYLLLSFLGLPWTLIHAWITGYGLHIAADLLTAGGVALLYPLSKRSLRLTSRTYDDPALNIPLILLSLALLAYTGYTVMPNWLLEELYRIREYVEKISDLINKFIHKFIR